MQCEEERYIYRKFGGLPTDPLKPESSHPYSHTFLTNDDPHHSMTEQQTAPQFYLATRVRVSWRPPSIIDEHMETIEARAIDVSSRICSMLKGRSFGYAAMLVWKNAKMTIANKGNEPILNHGIDLDYLEREIRAFVTEVPGDYNPAGWQVVWQRLPGTGWSLEYNVYSTRELVILEITLSPLGNLAGKLSIDPNESIVRDANLPQSLEPSSFTGMIDGDSNDGTTLDYQ